MLNLKAVAIVSVTVFVMLMPLQSAFAGVVSSGNCWPLPSSSGDYTATGKLYIGYSSAGSVDVTGGATLTTENSTTLGQMAGASGTLTFTDSTWDAESAAFIAFQYATSGIVTLNNSTWEMPSNTHIAEGDNCTGTVNLNNGSIWNADYVEIADGEDCQGTVNVNDGTWTVVRTQLGGTGFVGSNGTGLVNIAASGTMVSTYELHVTDYGGIELDGGTLSLAGENLLEGYLDATDNGGTIVLNVGLVSSGSFGRIEAGDGVDFTDCDIDIVWQDGFTPSMSATFDLFDTLDGVDLAALLGDANITTPSGWVLDYDSGVLAVPEPGALALLVLGAMGFMKKRRM